jgi:hypothetical protein
MSERFPVAAIAAAALIGLGLAGAIPVAATPLTITESNDFSNTPLGAVIGTLDVGVNTISGHAASISDPADYFHLALPAGMKVTEFELNVTNITHTLAFTFSGSLPQFGGDGSYDSTGPIAAIFNVPSVSFALNSSILFLMSSQPATLVSGPVTWFEGFMPDVWSDPGGLTIVLEPSFDYTLSYTVESTGGGTVPEPPTLALLGLGLAGLAVSRKRVQRLQHTFAGICGSRSVCASWFGVNQGDPKHQIGSA